MFENSGGRDEYIQKTFADLYEKPDETMLGPDCITDFLGDVTENKTVLNAKLNNTDVRPEPNNRGTQSIN